VTDPYATRGARKLEAAVRAFRLAPRIAGRAAIDVGASTGGFTATLLAHGAREVTAIDVGTQQLARELRDDPRGRVHEQTDVRRAPLTRAEGPFDFFAVDVSFMAARNVLRPLAFRLRAGAEGIVLLKPQFEVPSGPVRDGDVSDPRLRRSALARFTQRAATLGFEVVAAQDSEVAGGSGTVEIALHLRFTGRPPTLPKPGEQRRAAAQSAGGMKRREAAVPESFTWFAVAAPGLGDVVAAELRALPPCREVRTVAGGVGFEGPLNAGYAANLCSRVATRVLLRLGEVRAREFAELRRRLSSLPFEAFLSSDRPLRIQASAHRSRLYHTQALAEQLLHGASDRLGARLELAAPARDGEQDSEEPLAQETALPFGHEPFARLLIRGESNRFTVSIDSSGLLLHRRGARRETGRAPLRETLAAGILRLAGYTGEEPIVNAMCGAGTIALEAADVALARAPGRLRGFGFEAFPCFRRADFDTLREHAARAERSALPAPISAFDDRNAALEAARRNAERADALRHIRFSRADALEFTPPDATAMWIANPPYGHRLGKDREVQALYRALGEHLRAAWRGHRIALLVPRAASPKAFGLHDMRAFPLSNGGLPVKLLVGTP
jgi:putative N6-adenine-specific DNA methylase